MTRAAPEYLTGSVGTVGSGQRDTMFQTFRTALATFQSNGADAWEEADVINDTAGNRDIVFHSVGDRALGSGSQIGDTDLWVRMVLSSGSIFLNAYQDWSTNSHTGARQANNAESALPSDTAAFDWYFMGNAYEFIFLVIQTGFIAIWHGGMPRRKARQRLSGIARVATEVTTTGTVVVDLDRDIRGGGGTDIQVGQRIWLINQTVTGQTLDTSAFAEIVTVDAVSATTITLSGIVNQPYRVGSLVGLDPAPCYIAVAGFTAVGSGLLSTLYFCQRPDAGYTGNAAQVGIAFNPAAGLTEAAEDPSQDSTYPGFHPIVTSTQASFLGLRGFLEPFALFPVGTQSDGDLMIPESDASKAYKIFPSMKHTSGSEGWAIGLGPGAT